MSVIIADDVLDALSQVEQFRSFDRRQLMPFARNAREISVSQGETLILEGDVGNECFLIISGEMHVVGRRFDDTELILTRIGTGHFFGEQSLLTTNTARRSASVRATISTRLYAFGKDAFMSLVAQHPDYAERLERQGRFQAQFRDKIFKDTILSDLGVKADVEFQTYRSGEFVFKEGDRGDRVYLILSGSARASKKVDDVDVDLADLLPGQFFGELAVINESPRAASIQTTSLLEVASIDAAWFRSALASNPRLRSIMGSLQAMYMLPKRGLITFQGGRLGSEPTLTAVHHLPNGRRVISSRLVEMQAFTAHVLDAPEATASVRYRNEDGSALRTIHLSGERLVEIESEGAWDQLGDAFCALIDDVPISRDDIASFRSSGRFGAAPIPERDAAEVVCRCTGVTAGTLVGAIAEGRCTLDAVARRTTATMICGGCIPVVKEFLGEGIWKPVVCEDVSDVGLGIRTFRLRWLRDSVEPGLPGQHVVVQARIGGHWVERPYSLSDIGSERWCEITVKREPDGVFSPWLFDTLAKGSALRLSPPQGVFCVDGGNNRDIVFMAGGIGITPALAIARNLRRAATGYRLHIDYSASTIDHIICADELRGLERAHDKFSVSFRTTRDRGRITDRDIDELIAKFKEAVFMICGSEAFVESVSGLLLRGGIASQAIVNECFSPVG